MTFSSQLTRRSALGAATAAALSVGLSKRGQANDQSSQRLLGVTVLPEYVQSEGIEQVLDLLVEQVGANAVATSPYVMAEADRKTGSREPPADAGAGAVRLLDRPLFGKREVWVVTAPSFVPDRSLYRGLRYQPPAANELTRKEGPVVARFVKAAKERGLKVFFQVQAAIPPGYRVQFGGPTDDDRPRLPSGKLPERRLAKNGSLASPHIIDYEHALIRDLLKQYPMIDGMRFDWPEYPPYFLDAAFLDFSSHARSAAQRMGYRIDDIQAEVSRLYQKLHGGLSDADLAGWLEADGGRFGLIRALSDQTQLGEFLRFKAQLVETMIASFRQTMNDAGGAKMELVPNAFPPPWTLVSGMDYAKVAPHCSAISVKLYTMHWPMMLRFYGDQIMRANPGLSDNLLTKALVQLLDISDDGGFERLAEYRYPGPDEPHPVGAHAQQRKIQQAQRAAGSTPVYTLAHGYGPIEDYERRMRIGLQSSGHGVWLNRYAYLTNEKLAVMGQVTRQQ